MGQREQDRHLDAHQGRQLDLLPPRGGPFYLGGNKPRNRFQGRLPKGRPSGNWFQGKAFFPLSPVPLGAVRRNFNGKPFNSRGKRETSRGWKEGPLESALAKGHLGGKTDGEELYPSGGQTGRTFWHFPPLPTQGQRQGAKQGQREPGGGNPGKTREGGPPLWEQETGGQLTEDWAKGAPGPGGEIPRGRLCAKISQQGPQSPYKPGPPKKNPGAGKKPKWVGPDKEATNGETRVSTTKHKGGFPQGEQNGRDNLKAPRGKHHRGSSAPRDINRGRQPPPPVERTKPAGRNNTSQ